MERTDMVINDFLLFEEFCNLKCKYCEGFSPTDFLFKRTGDTLIMPEKWKEKKKSMRNLEERLDDDPTIQQVFRMAEEVLEKIDSRFVYPVLKVSGGEIFIVKETTDFLKRLAKTYQCIQVLTNGTLFDKRIIDDLLPHGNFYFQISLDGYDVQTNSARTNNQHYLKRILDNICYLDSINVPIELNCVLTDTNSAQFFEFVQRFVDHKNTTLFPRPVRGKPADVCFPKDLKSFETVLSEYNEFEHILPPQVYLKRVYDLLVKCHRSWGCYVPFYVLGENYYGTISTCTCSGELPMLGNVLMDDFGHAVQQIRIGAHYNPLQKYQECSNCITQYEIFNLFTENYIGLSELEGKGIYGDCAVQAMMQKIKTNLRNENSIDTYPVADL